MSSVVLGIDLGTTNSCVAVYEDGNVKIIKNEEDESTTPSFVYYSEGESEDEVIVGKTAQNFSSIAPDCGIFDSKLILGYKFDDEAIQENLGRWPFKIIKSENNEPLIEIKRNTQDVKYVTPEEVSAEILKKMKKIACDYLKQNVTNAVVTVPAYFSNAQKKATIKAASIAGLNVLKLINEPTAAGLAYLHEKSVSEEGFTLVYDLGGGTFDVSIMKFHDAKKGEVILVGGDTHLGGRDFDNSLLSYFIKEIKKIYDIGITDRRHIRRIQSQCVEIKKELSERDKSTLYLVEIMGKEIEITISREQFEKLNDDLFQKTIQIVDDVIKNAKIDKDEINNILLIGGSTRIPKIQQMVQDYFNNFSLNKSINPEEAVAYGAAVQAALLVDNSTQMIEDLSFKDVAPFSLGVATLKNYMSVIIEKGTGVPTAVEEEYYTAIDDQTSVSIRIFEGEDELVKNNKFLGEFQIDDITPQPMGEVKIIVKFEIDDNGILNVTAKESSKNIEKNLTITLNYD